VKREQEGKNLTEGKEQGEDPIIWEEAVGYRANDGEGGGDGGGVGVTRRKKKGGPIRFNEVDACWRELARNF